MFNNKSIDSNQKLKKGKKRHFIAYKLSDLPVLPITVAPMSRLWMDNTPMKFAYRCLPIVIANQAGWFILNSHRFRATWTGEDNLSSLSIEYFEDKTDYSPISHFGSGIITWNLPYLFRTPPNYNLLARGPANYPKDGVSPLEGIIETDWSISTFTMNWKMTCIDRPVVFEVGEPICMLVPQKRGELETFNPVLKEFTEDSEHFNEYKEWSVERTKFLDSLKTFNSSANKKLWQKDYFQGKKPNGIKFTHHQTKLFLKEFK